jgi:hypothetical protein
MSTIQELGAFLTREQAAVTAPPPAPSSPAVEVPATEAAFNTDYNGAPAARP